MAARVADCMPPKQRERKSQAPRMSGGIEIEAEGVTIRVGRGADVTMIAAIRPCAEGKPVIGPSRNCPGDGSHHAGRLPQRR